MGGSSHQRFNGFESFHHRHGHDLVDKPVVGYPSELHLLNFSLGADKLRLVLGRRQPVYDPASRVGKQIGIELS